MLDDFETKEVRSSGELWSEICSSLPEVRAEAAPDSSADFKDSFHPDSGEHVNGHANGTSTSSSSSKWEPMEDSEIYIASLGISLPSTSFVVLFLTGGLMSQGDLVSFNQWLSDVSCVFNTRMKHSHCLNPWS